MRWSLRKRWFPFVLLLMFKSALALNECSRCTCCNGGYNRCARIENYSDVCRDGCINGYYSFRCVHACINNCDTCSNAQSCTKCSDGFYGANCDKCQDNCQTCSDWNKCQSCKDGFYNGRLYDSVSYSYYSYCHNKCQDNCKSCTSYYTCTACKDGKYNVYNDCTESCNLACKACTSYNSCTVCQTGKYGATCQSDCGLGCNNHQCDIDTGECTCVSNFQGLKCDQCVLGKYGTNCEITCPYGCANNNCSTAGDCYSCLTGLTGNQCDQCSNGKYGTSCNIPCRTGCANNLCKRNGDCLSCKTGLTGNQCDRCSNGKYGTFCNFPCPTGCANNSCKSNGDCLSCKSGFSGNTCSNCEDGKYGTNCNIRCPTGCANIFCKINGECYSCKTGLSGVTCNQCEDGKYGFNCNIPCPTGCANKICIRNGDCIHCESGFSGNTCNECVSGKYGTDCNIPCPTGCSSNLCRRSGECYSCNSGFSGKLCNQCKTGKYGADCNISCSIGCENNICESNGECSNCRPGFDGNKCDQCISKKYGNNCDNDCPSHCLNCSSNSTCFLCETGFYGEICNAQCHRNCRDALCDKIYGRCITGCEDGFYDEMCDQTCNPKCLNTTCSRKLGECLHGCQAGFTGTSCALAVAQTGSDGDNTGVTIGAASGGGLFVVIVIVIVIVFLLLKRRRRQDKCEKNDMVEINANTDNTTATYSEIVTNGPAVEQHDADVVYAMPNKPKKNNDKVKPSNENTTTTISNPNYEKPSSKKGDIVDTTDDCKPQIAAKPVPVYDNSRHSVAKEKSIHSDNTALEVEEDIDSITTSGKTKSFTLADVSNKPESDNSDTYYNVLAVKKRKIALDQLPDFVAKKTKKDFAEEFQQLPPGLIKPYVDSQRRANMSKNRYKGIYPYDATRVMLKEGDSDYINASYIDGYNKRQAYIASIGPTYKYMGDMSAFWIMVWQEKVGMVVMLTNLEEGGAPKCDQYWPEKDFSLMYANIQVTCQSEETYADYTVRTISIQKDSEKRNIVQVHFTAWPDKGTPDDVTSLIEFRQKVISTKTEQEGPIIVHCSAGIGRTGTYIALDSLTKEGEAEGEVDIYACVRNMREQRVNMVQNAEQYQYLHNAVVHTLTFDSKAVEASNFAEYMTTHTDDHLRQKFERLQASVEQRSDDEKEAVKRNEALGNKNREGADIPGDRNRPKLYLDRKPGSSDYINAVYVNSYTTINRYLVAQTPLPDTVVDFLTLIVQEKVSCIISMETDASDDKTIGTYHPADNQTLKKGTFTVKSEREKSTDQYLLRTLKIAHKGKSGTEEISVPHIHFTHWNKNKNIPEEPAKFVQFIKDVELKYGGDKSKGPILVHCLTGAEKSGLFCVVSNLLEKTQIDQETSVVNTVRQVKYRRHMSIPNKDQYIFCHQCVNEYLRTFDIYSNFELKT